jgi:hypothetical protein
MLSKSSVEALILMLVYCGFLIAASVICAFVGYEIDELWGGGVGVTLSIFAFFASCWLCWVLAVRVTEPRVPSKPL